jgi:subtilase family serine protease
MIHFRFQKAAYVAAFFVTFAFCASLQGQQHPLRTKHIPDLVRNGQASAVGQLETDHPLHLVISLPLRNEDALDTLLQQIYDPQSPNFHHYLTPQQFTDGFGPAQQDYDAVVAWAKAKGLQVTATTANRRLIEVAAAAGTVNRAFNVQLNTYQDNRTARTFHAPDREPTVDLSVPLLAISGLDDATPPHSHLKNGNELAQASNTITENLDAPVANAIAGSGPGNTISPATCARPTMARARWTAQGRQLPSFRSTTISQPTWACITPTPV